MTAPDVPVGPVEIRANDVVAVDAVVPEVVLTEEQRGLLKRVLETVLTAIYGVEIVVEVAPDGAIRFSLRLRS
jgi:hypothetical protein